MDAGGYQGVTTLLQVSGYKDSTTSTSKETHACAYTIYLRHLENKAPASSAKAKFQIDENPFRRDEH